MVDIDVFEHLLNEVADEIPDKYYENLNGGVIVVERIKIHPKSVGDELIIMGEYQNYYTTGRQIILYYGSFARRFGWCDDEGFLKNEIRKTLRHELTHHWESQAGEHQLEDWDREQLMKYSNNRTKK